MVQKIDRQELQLRFLEAINGANYRFIDGLNPFHIVLNDKEYWIYLKNLSSAHFSNPDVWRAQLPLRDDFEAIKSSDIDFVLLGYDGDNDVYASWNPIWVKQRLNSTDNVSLYSRLSLQEKARKEFALQKMDLGNDGEVVVFPREMTRLFFQIIDHYFVNTGDYVAIGSKRRPEANEAFKNLTSIGNVDGFAKYLTEEGLSSITIGSYCRVIRSLISEGFFTRHRKVFLQYDSIEEYDNAINQFIKVPEIKEKNEKWHNLISAALSVYIGFIKLKAKAIDEEIVDELPLEEDTTPSLSEVVSRSSSEELFFHFCDLETVARFERALFNTKYLRSTVKRYSRAIRYLIKEGLLEKHKDVFLNKSSYSLYQDAANEFFRIPEIHELNEDRHHDYSAAMKQYLDFLVRSKSYIDSSIPGVNLKDNMPGKKEGLPKEEEMQRDWEGEFTDEHGKLTRIANPELLERLRPVLDREYPNAASAFNIVEDFYGTRFKDMEFFEWGRLFRLIDWSNPIPSSDSKQNNDAQSRKTKSVILRVELPDGRVLEHKNVSTTYCEVIQYIGPEEVSILGIYHAGVNIVSRELNEKYADYQRSIGDGWYVMTNTSTPVKYQDLITISKEYGVKMKVEIVPIDPSATMTMRMPDMSGSARAKIRVKFPDGRIIQPNKVLNALLEVVKYAGAGRVHDLNIICCGENLVLRHPHPRYENPCKPVGDGWWCNTYSNTSTKYEQIVFISDKLGLDLNVEMIQ